VLIGGAPVSDPASWFSERRTPIRRVGPAPQLERWPLAGENVCSPLTGAHLCLLLSIIDLSKNKKWFDLV
jgi:hypothetical protein